MKYNTNHTPNGAIYTNQGAKLISSENWRESSIQLIEFHYGESFEVITACNSISFSQFVGHSKIQSFGSKEWMNWESGCTIGEPGWEQRIKGNGQSQHRIVCLSRDFTESVMNCSIDSLKIRAVANPNRDLHIIKHLLCSLRAEVAAGRPGGVLFAECVAMALLQFSCEQSISDRVSSKTSHSKIKEIPNFINEHLAEDLTLSRISDVMNMSIRQLTGEFRKEFGQTLHQYIICRRVDRAVILLRLGLSAADVAMMTGFDGATSVVRAINDVTGNTVTRIRKSQHHIASQSLI